MKTTALQKLQFLGILSGIVLMEYGMKDAAPEENIEIISAESVDPPESTSSAQIYVDISGAVNNPGVYVFNEGERVNDALIKSGGLREEADSFSVSKSLNLASKLSDGMKLYLPFKGEESSTLDASSGSVKGSNAVNLNKASLTELDTLKGIGEARAKTIIDNRPYISLEDFKAKTKISGSLFEGIKEQITLN